MHLRPDHALRLAFVFSLAACGEANDPEAADTSTSDDPPATMTASMSAATADDASDTMPPDGEPVAIVNSGFETPQIMPGALSLVPPMGWQAVDPQMILNGQENSVGVLHPSGSPLFPDGAPEGTNVALVFLWQTQGIPVGLTQVLSETLVAGATYRLGVDVGNIGPNDAPFDLTGFPGYRVELRAGDTVLVADEDSVAPPDGEFQRIELTYTADADAPIGMPIEIRLINLSRENSGIEVNFDDVRLYVVAP